MKTISRDKLFKFCTDNEIVVQKTATREQLEAAIARSYLNGREVKPHKDYGCFGLYSEDDMTCQKFCDYREDCIKASLGMTEEQHDRLKKSVVKVRFANPIFR